MNELLTMIDCHPNYYVSRRCREPLPFISKKVIITSCMQPFEVYKNLNKSDKLSQLYRRLKVYWCNENGKLERIDEDWEQFG